MRDDGAGRASVCYGLQLISSYPATMLVVLPLAVLLGSFGLSGDHPSHIHFAGYEALLCLLVGPWIGYTAAWLAPTLAPTGRWMWVPASPVVISLIVKAMLPPQRVPWLPEEFFVTAGNEGLSVVLLTLPACSAMGYSIGVLLAGGFRSRTGGGRAGLARQLLLLALISLALLVPLTSVVHKFEQTRVLGWSKVRSIIEPLGLPISTDPNLLCAAPTGARLHLLRPAMVESLGSGVCSGGRLIETKGPQTSSAFSIERVKVLDGPEAGREGWVQSYGLQ